MNIVWLIRCHQHRPIYLDCWLFSCVSGERDGHVSQPCIWVNVVAQILCRYDGNTDLKTLLWSSAYIISPSLFPYISIPSSLPHLSLSLCIFSCYHSNYTTSRACIICLCHLVAWRCCLQTACVNMILGTDENEWFLWTFSNFLFVQHKQTPFPHQQMMDSISVMATGGLGLSCSGSWRIVKRVCFLWLPKRVFRKCWFFSIPYQMHHNHFF